MPAANAVQHLWLLSELALNAQLIGQQLSAEL